MGVAGTDGTDADGGADRPQVARTRPPRTAACWACGQRGYREATPAVPPRLAAPLGAHTVDPSTYLLIRDVRCEKICAHFKTPASVMHSMRTMRGMHRFEHRKRQEATVAVRAVLLVHYC